MSLDLAEIYLGDYCNELLGESAKSVSKRKSEIQHKKRKVSELKTDEIIDSLKPDKPDCAKITEDGFKICFEIPPDDSDVSDAFDSDYEDSEVIPCDENQKKFDTNTNQTEDGFKIIKEIPPDDSDISDAFESDLDEGNWIPEVKQKLIKTEDPNSSSKSHTSAKVVASKENNSKKFNRKFENIKKPLLDLIQDFGIEDKFNFSQCNIETNVTRNKKQKVLRNSELNITDYSKKRGKKKKKDGPILEHVNSKAAQVMKKETEEALKKVRYEIYKFGSTTTSDNVERRNAKMELAVKLGAKPLKNKAVNYKKLIEIRKEKKEKEKVKREETREMGLPVQKPIVKPRQKKDIDVNPRIGIFKGGVLRLSKKDVESIKSS